MKILVSGAGMAGLSAGISLAQHGHEVTLVERADHLRVNGSPIDLRGDAVTVAGSMGVLDEIRERSITMSQALQFVGPDGVPVGTLPGDDVSESDDDLEIPREDLAEILHAALPESAHLRFGDWIESMHDDGAGVDVVFHSEPSGQTERFDLVVGADGVHSAVRRMTFGPEHDYVRHLGHYVALANLPEEVEAGRASTMFNFPGGLVGIARYRDHALGVFQFRSDWIDYDHRDLDAQKAILADVYGGHDEWKVPQILAAGLRDPELYFDAACQIHMPQWHSGRIVLVGDAAACAASLSGRGTSLALTGTRILAEELDRHPGDLSAAFAGYEVRQRPYVEHAQAYATDGGDLIVPTTWAAIEERNARLGAVSVAG